MKSIVIILFSCASLSNLLNAQQQTPQLLKQPSNWQFERLTLPPEFAPNLPYTGMEELRFSPGMFNKDTTTYFTYAFVAQLDNMRSISQIDVKNYLLEYFKGLCGSTAKNRNLSVDTSKIAVALERKANTGSETVYNAVLNIFGVFTDGAAVKLNMEIKVLTDASASKIFLVVIASPHERSDAVWKELHAIQKQFMVP